MSRLLLECFLYTQGGSDEPNYFVFNSSDCQVGFIVHLYSKLCDKIFFVSFLLQVSVILDYLSRPDGKKLYIWYDKQSLDGLLVVKKCVIPQ